MRIERRTQLIEHACQANNFESKYVDIIILHPNEKESKALDKICKAIKTKHSVVERWNLRLRGNLKTDDYFKYYFRLEIEP